MKINLERKILNLKGQEIKIVEDGKTTKETIKAGEVLAQLVLSPLANRKGFRALPGLRLARTFWKGGQIDLEESMVKQLKDLVEYSVEQQQVMPLVAGQIIEELDGIE